MDDLLKKLMDALELREKIALVELKADQALSKVEQCEDKVVENEQRAKSLQHRVDAQDNKMNTLLDKTQNIENQNTEIIAMTKGIKTAFKAFASILSVAGVILSIIQFFK